MHKSCMIITGIAAVLLLLSGCGGKNPEAAASSVTAAAQTTAAVSAASDTVTDMADAGRSAPEAVQRGVSFLQALEAADPADVDATLQYLHEHDRAEMHDEMMAKLASGEVSCWSLFEDYLILGDSRTIGFSYYGFLPEDKVWAETGETIRKIQVLKEDILAQAPANLFLCYGMNDFVAGIWDSPQEWAEEYAATIREIHDSVPGITVFVCSILPASEQAEGEFWYRISEWNEALVAVCDTMDYCEFVDCEEVALEHTDLYEYDGKHFVADFYPYLGTTMVMALYDHGFDDDTDAAQPQTAEPTGTEEADAEGVEAPESDTGIQPEEPAADDTQEPAA